MPVDTPDPSDWEAALRDGLRRQPAPPVSADFDARVFQALRAPRPWWRALWAVARPVLAGMACSLSLTLLALTWTTQAPVSRRHTTPPASAPRCLDMAVVDHLIDRPGLSAASLAEVTAPHAPVPSQRRLPPPHQGRVSRLDEPVIV